MVEKAICLGLPAEYAPLASSPCSGLLFRRALAIFETSKLACGDHFGDPQPVALCLIGGHAVGLLFLLAVLREHVKTADAIRRFDSHVFDSTADDVPPRLLVRDSTRGQ